MLVSSVLLLELKSHIGKEWWYAKAAWGTVLSLPLLTPCVAAHHIHTSTSMCARNLGLQTQLPTGHHLYRSSKNLFKMELGIFLLGPDLPLASPNTGPAVLIPISPKPVSWMSFLPSLSPLHHPPDPCSQSTVTGLTVLLYCIWIISTSFHCHMLRPINFVLSSYSIFLAGLCLHSWPSLNHSL